MDQSAPQLASEGPRTSVYREEEMGRSRSLGQGCCFWTALPNSFRPVRLASFLYHVDQGPPLLVSSPSPLYTLLPNLVKQLTFDFKTSALKPRKVAQVTQVTAGFDLEVFFLPYLLGLWALLPSASSGPVGGCLPSLLLSFPKPLPSCADSQLCTGNSL